MLISIVLKVLLFTGFIGAVCVAVFMWLNSSDAAQDEQTYEEDFRAEDQIAQGYIERSASAPEYEDHAAALRHWAIPGKSTARPVRVVTVKAPVMYATASTAPSDVPSDVIDAEIIETRSEKSSEENPEKPDVSNS